MSGPLYIPDKEEVPVLAPPQGALAPPVSGGLRGFLRKAAKPLFYGFASGVTGDPMYGMKVEAARQQAQAPSLQDTLTQLRIRDYENRLNDSKEKKEAEKAKQEKLAKLSEFIRVGDIESARAIATELEPKSAIGELFRAPPAPPKPQQVVVGGQTKYGTWNPETRQFDLIEGVGGPRNTGVTVNTGEQPFTTILAAQRAYEDQSKPFFGIARGLDIARGLQFTNNSAANINLITAVAKAVDPTSAVMQGEVVMREEFRSIQDRLKGLLQRAAGGGFLTQKDRDDIVSTLESELRSRSTLQRDTESQFGRMADHFQVPRDFIIPVTVDQLLERSFQNDKPKNPRTISAEEARELGLVK